MRKILFLMIATCGAYSSKAQATITVDKNWTEQNAIISNSMEAELIIRIGDVDNLGFGWPEDFDPFCGRMTMAHAYPWDLNEKDLPGFDRILLSSKLKPSAPGGCGGDGYSGNFDPQKTKPVPYNLNIESLNGIEVKNAYVQLFIDDFQAPAMCSKFNVTINGKRFIEAEKIINIIEQTGPVGKLISIPIPEEFYPELKGKSLEIKIDEVNGAPDGWAIDFIRLLINRKRENTCKGTAKGRVFIKNTETPIVGATVTTADKNSVKTNNEGYFEIKNIPTGFEFLGASAIGYADGGSGADVGEGEDNPEVYIYLEPGTNSLNFDKQSIKVGQSINLNKILFDQGKSILRPESKNELDKITLFLKDNPSAEIELSGHTSAEGDAALNRSLSYQRVKTCKDYIVNQGVETGRIIAIGFGPDKPVAPNDNETNRALNRRVEMRLLKG